MATVFTVWCEKEYFMKKEEVRILLNDVSVIIPISLSNEERRKAYQWILEFYHELLPEVELCIGETNETNLFSRAKAINLGVKKATRDKLVIADGDLFFNPLIIEEAVKELDTFPWVIPFSKVFNISKKSSNQLYLLKPQWPIPIKLDCVKRPQMGWGGINVVSREKFYNVGGFDERFAGWGGEDDAFAFSMNNLYGSAKRLNHSIFHLWHPSGDLSNYSNNMKLLKKLYIRKRRH